MSVKPVYAHTQTDTHRKHLQLLTGTEKKSNMAERKVLFEKHPESNGEL